MRLFSRELRRKAPHATISAHEMYWQILDADGRVVREAESPTHNIILNQTWDDLIAVYGFRYLSAYAAVGTGSTAPDAAQTQLEAEVARTAFVPSGEREEVVSLGSGVFEVRRVKQFTGDQVGGQNLTEWGWAPISSGANLSARELFRDANGDPVVVSVNADQSLRLIYKQRVTVSPEPMTAQALSFDMQNVGTYSNAQYWLSDRVGVAPFFFADFAARGKSYEYWLSGYGLSLARKTSSIVATRQGDNDVHYISTYKLNYVSYTSGERKRVVAEQVIDENTENDDWYGFVYLVNNYNGFSYLDGLWLDFGDVLTKDNLHRLIIPAFTILTWGP